MSVRTLVDSSRAAADAKGDCLAFSFWRPEQQEQRLSFGGLDAGARRVAAHLSERLAPGSRALLCYAPGIDFLEAFFGCLYAGVVAVPLYPPELDRLRERVANLDLVRRDTDAEAMLCDAMIVGFREQILELCPGMRELWWVDTTKPSCAAEDWIDPGICEDAVAYLQYTSGSTGRPKGVVLRHRQLLANQVQISQVMDIGAESRIASWLPVYHDMGLIGCVMQPIHRQIPSHLMSPLDFMVRPARWLELVARTRATISGAPNFAFDLCLRKVDEEEIAELDLSDWRVAFCGAEPVRPETMCRFARRFARAGFDGSALQPCYGLAEASLLVAGARAGAGHGSILLKPEDRRGEGIGMSEPLERPKEVSSCGQAAPGTRLRVVEPSSGEVVSDATEGEIWVQGPSVAGEYWRQPSASDATFAARLVGEDGCWLRTGDRGFLLDGELYVTGRLGDMLIVRGRNVHPHDVEDAIQAADRRFRPGCGAVFGIEGSDRVVLVQETTATEAQALRDLSLTARRTATLSGGVDLEQVVLVAPRTVPKTSSGKIRRRRCRELFLRGELQILSTHPGSMKLHAPDGATSEASL